MHHRAIPVFFPDRSHFSAQSVLRIADETKRKGAPGILPKGIVILVGRLIDLSIADDPLAQLPPVLGRLRADSENGDVVFLIPSVFVDKGRNLGPAPGSPLAAVKENNRRRRLG
jgi:hypothetical protein